MSGQTFSHYRLFEVLGEGGMGVVYRAEDTALGRPVALKFMHARTLEREALRTRFLREARLAASISHPNVCTIYEVGEVPAGSEAAPDGSDECFPAGTPFIAMELLTGETLHDRLARAGRLSMKDLLNVAIQIAEGMHEAHARNIVHRDLKPHNVVVDGAGRVKILDFGLAKPLEQARPDDAVMAGAQTQSAELTRLGGIVGTAAYMSPEQAQGRPLDSRSDLFSVGTMLYELASGTRPFGGDSATTTIANIITADPRPLREIAPHVPPELDRIVRRCLQKDPSDRYHDARDLMLDLKEVQQALSSGVTSRAAPPRARTRRAIGGAAVGIVVLAAILGVLLYSRSRVPPASGGATHQQITFAGDVTSPAVSPDGKFVAYVSGTLGREQKVVVQELAGGQPLEVYKGRLIGDVRWSPDGSRLLFGAGASEAGFARAAFVVPRLGGTPRQFPVNAEFVSWSPDGERFVAIVSSSHVIPMVDASTGATTQIQVAGSFSFISGIDWSPDGRQFAVVTRPGTERSTLSVVNADGTGQHAIVNEDTIVGSPRWSPTGDAVYYMRGARTGTFELWKVPLSIGVGQATAPAARVMAGLPFGNTFTVARDGKTMAYARAIENANLWLVTVSETGARAEPRQLTTGTFSDTRPAISPDGSRVVFSRRTGDKTNLFVMDLDGGSPRQLTFFDHADSPAWSPDGKQVAFTSDEGGSFRIWTVGASGGPARVFAKTNASPPTESGSASELAWSPAPTILYQVPGNRNLSALDPASERETSVVKDESVGWIFAPSFARDGRLAVYWNRPPQFGVWVISPDSTEKEVRDGFAMPTGWSSDGKWVYILEGSGPARLVAAPADGGTARVIADLPWPFGPGDALWCTTVEGRRFVCAVPQSTSDAWIARNYDPER